MVTRERKRGSIVETSGGSQETRTVVIGPYTASDRERIEVRERRDSWGERRQAAWETSMGLADKAM